MAENNKLKKRVRGEAIRQKLISLEMWVNKAAKLEDEEKQKKAIKEIMQIVGEIWLFVNTSNGKGKEFGWWE